MNGWRVRAEPDQATCSRLEGLPDEATSADGCEVCVREGAGWIHLRRCLSCGRVGCCNSSPQRYAARWRTTEHLVAASAEPGERWARYFPDELLLVQART